MLNKNISQPRFFRHGDELFPRDRLACSLEDRERIDKARKFISDGSFDSAESILLGFDNLQNPEVEFLLSGFSLKSESEEEFVGRSIKMLESAAQKKYSPALYELAVAYDTGDAVEEDRKKAAILFGQAAHLGHIKAKWVHGTALIYSQDKSELDIALGMEMIKSSADDHYRPALIALAEFYRKGEFGLPVDENLSDALRALAESDNAIEC